MIINPKNGQLNVSVDAAGAASNYKQCLEITALVGESLSRCGRSRIQLHYWMNSRGEVVFVSVDAAGAASNYTGEVDQTEIDLSDVSVDAAGAASNYSYKNRDFPFLSK